MFVDYSISSKPIWSEPVCLNTVFRLKADSSYKVNHAPLKDEQKILVIVTAGSGFLELKKQTKLLEQGDIFIFNPCDEPFKYNTVGGSWDFWWFEFSGSDYEFCEKVDFSQNTYILNMCDTCLKAVKSGNYKEASTVFSALLGAIWSVLYNQSKINKQISLRDRAISLIEQNIANINVAGLAAKLCISERTLHDVFVSAVHCSPKQYILNAKLNSACFLLKNTNKTVAEISEYLGFSSPFHFSRFFSRRMNTSPIKWRKKTD